MSRHRLHNSLDLANRTGQIKGGVRVALPQFLEQERHISPQMATTGNKHRQHDDVVETLGKQRFSTLAQSGLHELQKSDLDAHIWSPLAHRQADAAHRVGPLRVARAVSENDKGGS